MNSRLLQRFVELGGSGEIAVCDEHGRISFLELATRARALAARLEAEGLGGQRLALLTTPDRNWLIGFWAVLLVEGTVVPLSPLHPPREQAFFLTESRAAALLVAEALALGAPSGRQVRFGAGDALDAAGASLSAAGGGAHDAAERVGAAEDAIALILYTSGTTGKPKGVLLSHANVFECVRTLHDAWAVSAQDRLVHALPLHHVHGICVALLWAYLGAACSEMLPRYEPGRVLEAAARSSVIMGVPTQHAKLVAYLDALPESERQRHAERLRQQRLITSGSAALPETLGRRLEALCGQYPLERYGMTEVGIVLGNPLDGPRRPGCVGQALPRCQVRLVDDAGRDVEPGQPGEIWIAAPSVFRGYDEDPSATAASFADGHWFKSGDTALWTAERHVKILGRTSVDIIKSGGYKLSALELEEHLREHPWVQDVAVVGVPDETWGERVVAVIIPSSACPSSTAPSAHEALGERLRDWMKERIAAYKVPKQILVRSELPRNAMGKVQKPALLAVLGREDAQNVHENPAR